MSNSEKPFEEHQTFHLAGIIPVHGIAPHFGLPWHISLMPIGENYTMIENAVVECAAAGCESIWIIASEKTASLLRRRVGEYILDPNSLFRFRTDINRKYITIHYVPVKPIDRDRRDCLAWSALYGCRVADNVSRYISKWFAPDRFYICFPYGVTDFRKVIENRKGISSPKFRRYVAQYNGENITDGKPYAFTMTMKEVKQYQVKIRNEGTGRWDWSIPREQWKSKHGPNILLPKDEQYSARFFTLKDVFEDLPISEEEDYIRDMEWYHTADTWEGYRELLGDKNITIKRPPYAIAHYREWNSMHVEIKNFKDEDKE